MLDKSNAEIAAKLSLRLKKGDYTSERFVRLMRDIRIARKSTMLAMKVVSQAGLIELAKAEQQFSKTILETALPVRLDYAVATTQTLRTLVTAQPFSGGANAARTLSQWWEGTAAADQGRILESIQQGMIQSETVPQMVKRVSSATEMTRRNAEAVVRTSVNHVSNASREAFFAANTNVVQILRWTSMLDGRTTAICRARDGHFARVEGTAPLTVPLPVPALKPPTARPPAHPS
jgi:SPP1 gp7 family putative phage head morphogenesis protein